MLEENPKDAKVWIEKGNMLQKLGEYYAALESYDEAVKKVASNTQGRISAAKAWIGIGDALRALGKNQEALEAYERAIGIHPDFGEAWQGKSEVQKAEGDAYNASISLYVAGKLGSAS